MSSEIYGGEEYPSCTSFDDFGLEQDLLQNIRAYGLERPVSMQQHGLMPIIDGRDTFLEARSGTGKTTAFVICCIRCIDSSVDQSQALILTPTRELAVAIGSVATSMGNPKLKSRSLSGGGYMRDDLNACRHGQHLLIGTPGRVYDMMRRDFLKVDDIKLLAMDEVQELISRGFSEQIHGICCGLPPDVQVCLNTETKSPECLEMIARYMKNPVIIRQGREHLTLEGVRQFYLNVEWEQWKIECLRDLHEHLPVTRMVVYCNTRRKADFVANHLERLELELPIFFVHADTPQQEREAALKAFRKAVFGTLVCPDLPTRHVDIPQVGLTVNYDLPTCREVYLQRLGRCGTYARNDMAITLVTPQDLPRLQEIEAFYRIGIEEAPSNLHELF